MTFKLKEKWEKLSNQNKGIKEKIDFKKEELLESTQ